MIKISTLYKKNPENLGVIDEINPENQWVIDGEGVPTIKLDGTAAAIINGELYRRYDVKKGRQVPPGAIPCQEPDVITGHWPHWVLVDVQNPEDKYFVEAWYAMLKSDKKDGTYELCGPKVNGNKEGFDRHYLMRHGQSVLRITDFSFEGLKKYFSGHFNHEGIVFHHPDGRMCKIRKSDFGIKR